MAVVTHWLLALSRRRPCWLLSLESTLKPGPIRRCGARYFRCPSIVERVVPPALPAAAADVVAEAAAVGEVVEGAGVDAWGPGGPGMAWDGVPPLRRASTLILIR